MRGRRSIRLHIDQAVVDGGRGRGGGGGSGRARSVLIVLFLLRIPGRRCFLIRHRDPADGQLDEVESGVCVGDEGGQAGAFLAGGGGAWVWKRRLSFFFFLPARSHLSTFLSICTHPLPPAPPPPGTGPGRPPRTSTGRPACPGQRCRPGWRPPRRPGRPGGGGPAPRRRFGGDGCSRCHLGRPHRRELGDGGGAFAGRGVCACQEVPWCVCVCGRPRVLLAQKKTFMKSETGAFIFR